MNPFSAFLQPPTQRSPLAGAGEFVQGLQQQALQKKQFEQSVAQHADSSARDWKRIGLQETAQNRQFSEADKKEVEAALAEYQDAEDQGDPVRLSRAAQMLKRFGMDVSQGGVDPRAEAFTGAKPLPGMLPMVPGKGNAFTGTAPDEANPIGDAIATEQATREKLRTRTEDPGLSQEDFEADLIANPTSIPEPAPDEVIDLDAEDPAPLQFGGLPKASAGTKESPVPEGTVDGGDLDAVEQTSQAPQVASQMAPALPGGLPVRISKGGKQLYESTGPSGRWAPMVQGVFQAAAQHQDPEYAQAGKNAQALVTKLISVDGISPKQAIELAKADLDKSLDRINNLRRTELGTRPKWGVGGGAPASGYATGAVRTAQGALTDDAWNAINNTMVNFDIRGLNKADNGLANAQSGLNSDNPASQRGAIRNILKAMSGLTVNAKEEAGYERLAGLAELARNKLAEVSGDDMSPQYIASVKQMLSEWRAESARIRGDAGRRAADAYMGFSPQAPPDVIQGQADTIYRYFVGGDTGASKYKPPQERKASPAGKPGYDPELDG